MEMAAYRETVVDILCAWFGNTGIWKIHLIENKRLWTGGKRRRTVNIDDHSNATDLAYAHKPKSYAQWCWILFYWNDTDMSLLSYCLSYALPCVCAIWVQDGSQTAGCVMTSSISAESRNWRPEIILTPHTTFSEQWKHLSGEPGS